MPRAISPFLFHLELLHQITASWSHTSEDPRLIFIELFSKKIQNYMVSFVVLYFVLFPFSGLYLVTVACHLSF